MFFMSLTKNFMQFNRNHNKQWNLAYYLIPIILWPFMSLILARFYMLRRGRDLNKISLDYFANKFMKGTVSTRCPDLASSLRVWDNTPILNVYFDDSEI